MCLEYSCLLALDCVITTSTLFVLIVCLVSGTEIQVKEIVHWTANPGTRRSKLGGECAETAERLRRNWPRRFHQAGKWQVCAGGAPLQQVSCVRLLSFQ